MNIRILLADYQRLFRAGLVAMLSQTGGFEVVAEADDGRDALQQCLAKTPTLVITEVDLPQLNGIDMTREIMRRGSDTRVLALTYHRGAGLAKKMIRAGADGYLLKTGTRAELLHAIGAVANGQTYLSSEIAHVVISTLRGGNGKSNGNGNGHISIAKAELSRREREVLQLVSEGHSTKAIASRLCVSAKTIESHRHNTMHKLDVHSIAGLTKYALREGLTSLDV